MVCPLSSILAVNTTDLLPRSGVGINTVPSLPIRVDVLAEAHPWYRIIKADLFVLALLACATTGLAWSYFQSSGSTGLGYLFLVLFITSNIVLFGGVYWSKFAHMIYKPGAAIQKNLAEADGSRDNLPPLADAPKQFGLGIKREQPKHY